MKAKDIAKIQVCDNTGVAKGTVGLGNVLDINMLMPDSVKGFVEGQGGFGKDIEGSGTVNVLYGSQHTDIYANAAYRYQEGNKEYMTLHMTNRHTFNDVGTELLVVGGYQYASDPIFSNKLPLYIIELNTPLLTKRLSMMVGVEGDFLMTRQKDTDRSWDVFNHDIYLQFTYSLPQWRFTVGNRVMFYNYKLVESGTSQKHSDTRNNTNACVIYVPDNRNQVQLGYYRKFYNPAYLALFMDANTLFDEEWARAEGLLDEWDIDQFKLSYAYSKQKLTVQTDFDLRRLPIFLTTGR